MLSKFFGLIKRHKIITAIIVVVLIVIIGYLFRSKPEPQGDFITLSKTDVVQEIDVTGHIEPAEKVQLTPESSGKINAVNIKVGDQVTAGDVLVVIDDSDLRIRLAKQQLQLRSANLALAQAEKQGKTSTQVQSENNLERSYEDRINASADYKEAIDAGYNSVSEAFLDLPDVITDLKSILGHSYLTKSLLKARFGNTAVEYRDDAWEDYIKAKDLFDESQKEYKLLSRQSDQDTIKTSILDTYETSKSLSDAIKTTQYLLDYAERRAVGTMPGDLATDQTTLNDLTRALNDHLIDLLDIKNKITQAEQDITDSSRVIDERSATNQEAKDSDELEIENLRISVAQAQLDIQDTQIEIDKRSIKAPMAGIVTDVTARRGENISPGTSAVSVISVTNFQVTANLPEVDMAKIRVAMEADVTLDAYGSEVNFPMVVSSISPAEKSVEGVSVYEVILQFIKADNRIKSGLTADITIKGELRKNVLAVPQRAVITKNKEKLVQIKQGDVIVDKPVKTGLRGTDGNIEITSGLEEGDLVLVFQEGK